VSIISQPSSAIRPEVSYSCSHLVPRTSLADKKDMRDFHMGVRAVFPDRLFAFGYMGAYDFLKAGYTQEEFESFPADIAKMGVVWQVQPIWATQGLSLHAKEFAEMFHREGIAGYMRNVAKPAMAGMATDKHGKPTSRGGYLADSFFDVVAGLEITGQR
jgi:isocitrate lyase